jgi:cytochrome c oxidase subunit II
MRSLKQSIALVLSMLAASACELPANMADQAKLQKLHVPLEGMWMPEGASTFVNDVDVPFWIIYWACVIVFIACMIPMFWFAWKYRQKSKEQKAVSQKDHSQLMEIAWSSLPLIFFFWVFVLGFQGFMNMWVAPTGATEVRVIGQKWFWNLVYESKTGDKVVVGGPGATFGFVKGKPYKMLMTSQDVLHSFYIPNFRVKSDVVPGRYTTVWFEATKSGIFPLFCTEYCGTNHSNMNGVIQVFDTEAEFDAWLKTQQKVDVSPDGGKALYASKGCNACHSVDGVKGVGPSWKGLYGSKHGTSAGEVEVNDAYIAESILNPMAKIAEGYAPAMPSYQGQLSTEQIQAITEYMKSIK